jgi:type I restriction enzyme M protein
MAKTVFVDVKDIRENKYDLSISRYKPVEYEEVVYEKPELIMKKVLNLEREIESYIKVIMEKLNE